MAAYSGFTNKTARLIQPGAIQWDTSGEMTLTDIYAVKVPDPATSSGSGSPLDDTTLKWRPLGWNVYQPGSGGSTTPVIVAAKNVNGIPERNSTHPNYPFMRAVSINWSQPDRASKVWFCEVRYRYSPASRDTTDDPGGSGTTKPVKWIDVEFYSHNITVPLSFANNGAALCTTAGEPITPEPTVDIASPCLRITARNKRAPTAYTGYMGSINNANITICGITFPKYCARLTYASRETEVTVGQDGQGQDITETYYEHTFSIEGNLTPAPSAAGIGSYAGWVKIVPNAGYSFLDSNGTLTRAQIASESDPTLFVDSPLPVPLDASGHKSSSFTYFTVAPGPIASWSGIGFPTTW